MAKMQKKSFARPEETRKFDKGQLELVTLGGVTFGRGVFQPGWRWSTSVKPLVKTKGRSSYAPAGATSVAWNTSTSSACSSSTRCRSRS